MRLRGTVPYRRWSAAALRASLTLTLVDGRSARGSRGTTRGTGITRTEQPTSRAIEGGVAPCAGLAAQREHEQRRVHGRHRGRNRALQLRRCPVDAGEPSRQPGERSGSLLQLRARAHRAARGTERWRPYRHDETQASRRPPQRGEARTCHRQPRVFGQSLPRTGWARTRQEKGKGRPFDQRGCVLVSSENKHVGAIAPIEQRAIGPNERSIDVFDLARVAKRRRLLSSCMVHGVSADGANNRREERSYVSSACSWTAFGHWEQIVMREAGHPAPRCGAELSSTARPSSPHPSTTASAT